MTDFFRSDLTSPILDNSRATRFDRSVSIDAKSPVKLRAQALCEAFPRIYPDTHCELNFYNPLELLLATILSEQ